MTHTYTGPTDTTLSERRPGLAATVGVGYLDRPGDRVSRSVTLKQGDKLGQYELLTPIGAGGMGRVWAAREGATGLKPRLVAIKTALAEDGATEGFWKVLFDEGRIASQVTHPNVCSIHAVEREITRLLAALERR